MNGLEAGLAVTSPAGGTIGVESRSLAPLPPSGRAQPSFLFATGALFVAGTLDAREQTALWMLIFFFASAAASAAYLTASEVFPLELQRRFEHQGRQKDVEDEIARQGDVRRIRSDGDQQSSGG